MAENGENEVEHETDYTEEYDTELVQEAPEEENVGGEAGEDDPVILIYQNEC